MSDTFMVSVSLDQEIIKGMSSCLDIAISLLTYVREKERRWIGNTYQIVTEVEASSGGYLPSWEVAREIFTTIHRP